MTDLGKKVRGVALSVMTTFSTVSAAHSDEPYFMPDDVLIEIQNRLAKTGQDWNIQASDFKTGDVDATVRLVCYDANNNGVADRNVAYSHYVNGKQAFEYGDIAYTRQSITAKTIDLFFDGQRDTYRDMQTRSALIKMQELNSQGRSGVAVVYAQHESREINGEMPIAYVISSTSTAVTIAQNPNWSDLSTPKQKFCDKLEMPAPGASG